MKCNNCGKKLPDFPKEEVERSSGEIKEVISHIVRETEGKGWASTLTDYYCQPDCFIQAVEKNLINTNKVEEAQK